MARLGHTEPALMERRARWGLRRAILAAVAFCASVVFLAAIGGGLLLLRLSTGPIDVNIAPQIAAALNARVEGRYAFSLGSTVVEQSDHGPQLAIEHFDLADATGRRILSAPRASVSVDPLDLLFGRISPKRIEVQDVTLRVLRLEDGSVGVAAGPDDADALKLGSLASDLASPPAAAVAGATPAAPGAPATPGVRSVPDRLAGLVGHLVDQMVEAGGPLHAVDRIGLRRGTLIVDDRLRHATTTYRDLTIDVDREATGGIFAAFAATGPSGRWSVTSRASRQAGGAKSVDLAADHLTTDELMLAAGQRRTFFETDMPLSFSLHAEVDADGRLRRAGGPVSFGAGYFKLDDPDHEPALVDRMEATLAIAPDTGAVTFGAGTLVAGPTHYQFALGFTPAGAGADDPWTIDGKASGVFGAERPGETPIVLDRIDFRMVLKPAARELVTDHFTVGGPEVAFGTNGVIQVTDAGFSMTADMEAGRMPAHAVLRLWPSWVAAPPRAWLLANVKGGTLEHGRGRVYLTNTDLDTLRRQRSIPDDHVHIEFAIANVGLAFMAGVPPLKAMDGTGLITGDTFTLNAPRAEMEVSPGHMLSAGDGSFTIPSMDPKPSPTEIKLRVAGGIDTLADLLSREALKPYADLPLDPKTVSGQIDGRLALAFKLGDRVPQDETRIKVEATARGFAATKVLGKEALTEATLAITAERGSFHAKGDGRIFGAPTTIDMKKVTGAPGEALVGLVLDEAARQKAGVSFGKALTGPVAVKIATTLASGDKTRAQVEVDFSRAVLDASLPGLKKAAGKASKASFVATQEGGRVSLDQIVFDNGSAAIRGSANLDANGGLANASFTQLRLSPGDDAKAELTRGADGLKLVVRGTNIDARPFFKLAMSGDGGSGGDGMRDLDLDLHANLLTGENAQALSGVDLRLVRRNNAFRRVQMSGRLGKGPFTVTTTGSGPGATIVIAARDAGATLAFLDLYKRMDGGRLDTTLRMTEGRIDGLTTIHQFTIKEDPSIKKLADEQIPSNSRNAGARIDASAVSFSKLETTFIKVGNRVDVKQGSMFGPNVGATVEGSIDFARDRVALSGTFVPLYGLNNLFSQIPLLGVLLGGGSHEGLFALNYRITGSASAPVLSFNPLSALAPGFLRKIFGALDDAAQQTFDPGQEAPAPVPAARQP